MDTKDILKELRMKKKMTQKDVSDKSLVSYSAYQKYESGERELGANSLKKLADFYGVSTDYLLGRPDSEPPKNPINAFAESVNLKKLEELLITEYLKLSDKQRESVISFMQNIIQKEQDRKFAEATDNETVIKETETTLKKNTNDKTMTAEEIMPSLEEKAEAYGEKAKQVAKQSYISEKKQESQALSANGSDAG